MNLPLAAARHRLLPRRAAALRHANVLRRALSPRIAFLAAVLAAFIALAAFGPASAQTETRFRATITCSQNPEMPITNGSFLVHWQAGAFWSPGERASTSLERIAEIGNSRWSERVLRADPVGGCNQPGRTIQWEFNARPGDLLSTAQKLWNTNDAFIGVTDLPLFSPSGRPLSNSIDLYAYDAGTEFDWDPFSPFRSGQPDASRGAENISNGVDTPDARIALSDQIQGPQANLSVGPAGSALPVSGTGGIGASSGRSWIYGIVAILIGISASAAIILNRQLRTRR